MPYASALSQHPLATHAVGEVVGRVLEELGPAPEVAVLFVSAAHTGVIDDIAGAVRQLLSPGVLIGCAAATVVGDAHEIEDAPAIALWAGRVPAATPVRLDGALGMPSAADLPPDATVLVLLADPFTFPTEDAITYSSLPVIGGLASSAMRPGGNRLVLDGAVHADGAVGVVLGGIDAEMVVSQGCRPIGQPMIVTAGEANLVAGLGGQPALERVQSELGRLGPEEIELVQGGLHIGRVIDEQQEEFGRGDFLVRNLLGADPERGVVAVGDEVVVGGTVQLHVRDAVTADEDLRHLLAGRHADGALLFTCSGRGTHMFGIPDHDATLVDDALGRSPVAGMSCQGEIGPVGGRSFLHSFTASLLLLRDRV